MVRRIVVWTRVLVTGLCVLLGLFVGVPRFSEYQGNKQLIEEFETMVDSHQTLKLREASILKQGEELKQSIADFRKRATTSENVTEVRDAILALIRDSGCKVRQFEMEDMARRNWRSVGDSVLGSDEAVAVEPGIYELCSSDLNVVTTGRYESIQGFLHALEGARFLSVIQDMTIQPIDSEGATVQLELRMSFFGLETPERTNAEGFMPGLMAAVSSK